MEEISTKVFIKIAILGFISEYTTPTGGKKCTYSPPASQCPAKWDLTDSPPTCALKGVGQLSWTAARVWCEQHGSDLVVIHGRRAKVFFTGYMKPLSTIWTALNDQNEKGKYVWISGKPTNYTSWAVGEPSTESGKRCVVMDAAGMWVTKPCTDTHSFLCQKPSFDGPSEIKMEIVFHRPPNAFFVDHEAVVSCTAMGAEDDNITWVTLSEDLLPVDLHSIISQKLENVLARDGKCHHRVVSTFTFNTHDHFHGVYLACFSYRSDNGMLCTGPEGRLAFCDIAHQFSLVDGPKHPPVFQYHYKGEPGPIEEGGTVRAVCTLHAGAYGLVQWVLNVNGNSEVVTKISPLITEYKEKMIGRTDKHISSTLRLKMSYRLSGISISCFAYDADSLHDPKARECTTVNPFCKRSDPIYVAGHRYYQNSFLHWFGIVLIFIIFAAVWTIILWPLTSSNFQNGEEAKSEGEALTDVGKSSSKKATKPDDQKNGSGNPPPETPLCTVSIELTEPADATKNNLEKPGSQL